MTNGMIGGWAIIDDDLSWPTFATYDSSGSVIGLDDQRLFRFGAGAADNVRMESAGALRHNTTINSLQLAAGKDSNR